MCCLGDVAVLHVTVTMAQTALQPSEGQAV